DGLAVSLTYRDRRFAVGATRGDGASGEEVTPNLRTVRSLPAVLRDGAPAGGLEIRGEGYPTHDPVRRGDPGAGGKRRTHLRQSAKRGGRFAAPARRLDHGAAAAAPRLLRNWGLREVAAGLAVGAASVAPGMGSADERRLTALPEHRGGDRVLRG